VHVIGTITISLVIIGWCTSHCRVEKVAVETGRLVAIRLRLRSTLLKLLTESVRGHHIAASA